MTINKNGLLSYLELCELIDDKIITGVTYDQVNSSSIDLTLGKTILYEGQPHSSNISLINKQTLHFKNHIFGDGGRSFLLEPNMFILACTQQIFNLPNNISAEYKLNSSLARSGLDHLNAGWADAGWNGSSLTLEFKNVTQYHTLILNEGMKCGQMVFYKHTEVPEDKSYSKVGQYNGDKSVSVSKGLRKSSEGKINIGDKVTTTNSSMLYHAGKHFKVVAYDAKIDSFFCNEIGVLHVSVYIPRCDLKHFEKED